MGTQANEPGLDSVGMEDRMDAIRLKQLLGGPLTSQELMCLQIEANGFGCKGSSPPSPSSSHDEG